MNPHPLFEINQETIFLNVWLIPCLWYDHAFTERICGSTSYFNKRTHHLSTGMNYDHILCGGCRTLSKQQTRRTIPSICMIYDSGKHGFQEEHRYGSGFHMDIFDGYIRVCCILSIVTYENIHIKYLLVYYILHSVISTILILTHLPLAAIWQTIFSAAFSWMKSFVIGLKFH